MIKDSEQKAFDNIFNDMIGNNIQFTSPIEDANDNLMKKFLIYADFTASGKGLRKIEDFIKYQVLPTYANVHSTVGHCAEITSKYLSEAKEYLRVYTNAKGNYSIIFHGQGATGGAHKLIEILSIKKYVSFYRDLKTAFEIKKKYYDMIERLGDNCIQKIKSEFKELFIDMNFCFKFKINNNYITKCVLCNKTLENEGGYHKHMKDNEHNYNLKNYYNNL